jgi:DNA polymerase III delta prime subunit
MLEKCLLLNRFIFIVNNESEMIDAINSRCITIKLSAPDIPTIKTLCSKIYSDKKIFPNILNNNIIKYRNLTEILNNLQYSLLNFDKNNQDDQEDILDVYITDLFLCILSTKDINGIFELRDIINKLSSMDTTFIYIAKSLFLKCINHIKNDKISHKLTEILSQWTHDSNDCINFAIYIECMCIDIITLFYNNLS